MGFNWAFKGLSEGKGEDEVHPITDHVSPDVE